MGRKRKRPKERGKGRRDKGRGKGREGRQAGKGNIEQDTPSITPSA